MLDLLGQRFIVTGGAGFLGRSIVALLAARGVPSSAIFVPRSDGFDLVKPDAAVRLMGEAFPGRGATVMIHCAGFVGGLGANRRYPARFFFDNLAMAQNLVEAARISGFVERQGLFVQVGTMCSYPADAPLPYREESLFRGLPDPEVASYGVAKLAILQFLEACRLQYGLRSAYVIPTGFFGPGDNTNPLNSHVIGALVKKYVDAVVGGDTSVVNWGTGSARRDFIYIEDAAAGVVRAAEVMDRPVPINLTGGEEVSIRELAALVSRLSGFGGCTEWDASKGDGQARRSLDGSRATELLGWAPRVGLEEGVRRTIEWYRMARA